MTYVNPFTKYRMSDGWAEHIARGSAGGIDYAMPVGTPITAPCDGRLENWNSGGGAGYVAKFYHVDGTNQQDQFLHLSKFAKPGYYKQGQVIGWSGGRPGAPGAGTSTGPHVHWHLILGDGRRVNPLEFLNNADGGLSGWKGLQAYLKRHWGYVGPIDGVAGMNTWKAMQTFLKSQWGYTGPVDGEPGPNTWKACQRWLAKWYGYTGSIDGLPGPMTNAAIIRAGAALQGK